MPKVSHSKATYFNGVMITFILITLVIASVKGCGTREARITQKGGGSDDNDNQILTCADGSEVGTTRRLECPAGQEGAILEACNASGRWVEADSSCRVVGNGSGNGGSSCEDKVTFVDNVQPLLQQNCLTCHPTYDFDSFSGRIDEAVRRVELATSGRKMPPPPRSALAEGDIEILKQWKLDGLLQECDPDEGGNGNGGEGENLETLTLDWIETRIEADLNRLRSRDRVNTRYISFASKINEGISSRDLAIYKAGMLKNINSIGLRGGIYRPEEIDARGALWRIDLDDLQLDASPRFGQKVVNGRLVNRNYWDLFLDFDRFKFRSETVSGLRIADLTQSAFAWADVENFNLVSRYDDEVYYTGLNMPDNQEDLFRLLNFDFDREIRDFNCNFLGGSESPISVNKNRLIVRCELDQSPLSMQDSYIYLTFDSLALDGIAERNLQQFPLLDETGSDLVFDFAASEIIWRAQNGLQLYWLNAADGSRQAEAPINIVTDVEVAARGLGTEIAIQNAGSCDFCHSAGILSFTDQILEFSETGGSEFNAEDLALIRAYYKPNDINQRLFAQDQNDYAQTLRGLGINPTATDPINFATDNFRRNWTLKKLCAHVLLEIDECRREINNSAIVKGQIGALLNRDGQVSFDQVINTMPDLLREIRFGLDDVDE